MGGLLLHNTMQAHLLGQVLGWEHQQSPGATFLMPALAAVMGELNWASKAGGLALIRAAGAPKRGTQ